MTIRKYIDALRTFINTRTGWDLVYFAGQHTLRSHLIKVINEYEVDSIIDVGANEGQFGLHMRSLGFRGKIYSFEPVNTAYKKLVRTSISDKNWQTFNFALGSKSGETLINVSSSSDFSSILEVNDYARERWERSQTTHQQTTEVNTLDNLASEGVFEGSGNMLLKMDTQGYDLEVFKGALSLLRHIRCMVSELSLIPIYEDMPSYLDSLSVFESNGFRVSGFYPITRNKNLTLNEVDCVLVNTTK
jgi:FkbM family methyltransferase